MSEELYKTITIEDVRQWESRHRDSYLVDILNGEYNLNEAREDILSFRIKEDHQ